MTIKLYLCGICEHLHPWDWNGDCRDDANRYAGVDDYAERNNVNEDDINEVPMEYRIAADLLWPTN